MAGKTTKTNIEVSQTSLLQEEKVNAAFSKQSSVFDEIYDHNQLILWIRNRVHNEVLQHIKPQGHLLELNCGTGIDALFFASNGIKVMATDNAAGMLGQLQQKIDQHQLQDKVSVQRCSFNELEKLGSETQYDYIFSNFGGLNCTDKLDKVLTDIDQLLKPGGKFTLVIMPKICLWEIGMVFKGYFKTAFRRFRKGGAHAKVEGLPFMCYYYNPNYIIKSLPDTYRTIALKGLSITVPPPFIEHFVERHPRLFKKLENWENRIWDKAPFNRWGDHFMITMEKKSI